MFSSQKVSEKKDKNGVNDISEDIKDELFTLTVDDEHVKGVVDVPFNFTVMIENVNWRTKQIEVFWESTGAYVVPRDELGQKVVFTQTGPANQTVELQSSLIGIFSLRFYTIDSNGRNIYINEEPEVQLIVRRENAQHNKMFTLVITVLIGIALLFMGLELDILVVLATMKKPIGPAIGMVCQFVLMPAFSIFLVGLSFKQTLNVLAFLFSAVLLAEQILTSGLPCSTVISTCPAP